MVVLLNQLAVLLLDALPEIFDACIDLIDFHLVLLPPQVLLAVVQRLHDLLLANLDLVILLLDHVIQDPLDRCVRIDYVLEYYLRNEEKLSARWRHALHLEPIFTSATASKNEIARGG